MGASQDYAQDKRRRDREAELRQQQLQDVSSQRDFQMALQDRTVQNDIKLQLIHEGLLAPGDLNNPDAVMRAYGEARARGLDKLYNELLTTPDDNGKPLLLRADLSDPAKIESAKQRLAEVRTHENKFKLEQPKLAQAELTRLNGESQQVEQRLAEIEQRLSEPQPQPDPNEVMRQAIQNIRGLKKDPNYTPSQAEIQAEVQNVLPQLQQRLDMRWYQDKQDASVQYQTLNARLQNISSQRRELESKFGVAPSPQPMTQPMTAPVSRTTRAPASPEQMAAAISAAIRSAAPAPAPTGPDAPPFAQTFNDPVIEQANDTVMKSNAAAKKSQMQSELNSLLQDIQSTDESIKKAQAPDFPGFYPNPTSSFGDSEISFIPDAYRAQSPPNLQDRAGTLVSLHNRRSELASRLSKLQAQLLGPAAAMTPPTISSPGFVQPTLGGSRGPTPFVPDNLLQPAY